MNTTNNKNIAKLAKEYRAAYKAWETARKRAYGAIQRFPNIADEARARVAYRHMEKARQALIDATK